MVAVPLAPQPRWERRLQQVVIVIARLLVAYLFLVNALWKLPPNFGCKGNFAFPTATADGRPDPNGSSGLCYWIGVESVYADQRRPLLVADLQYTKIGLSQFSIDIRPLSRLNGAFIDGFVKPNIAWFGYLIVGTELTIGILLLLGLFSRLGGLLALAIAGQLMVGLAGIPQPYEWEWGYIQMVLLSLLMVGLAPGRVFGLDALLRPRLAASTNPLARLLYMLT